MKTSNHGCLARTVLKYGTILAVSLRNRLAYGWDQVISSAFMLMIMFVFIALWHTTYRVVGQDVISGYTQVQMLWYLVLTETLTLSIPRLTDIISQEIKSGDLAYRLNKPYSYLLFHTASAVGEMLYRALLALVLGGGLVWALVGAPPLSLAAVGGVLVTGLLAQFLTLQYAMLVGLLAFWMEDTQGVWLLADRAKMILGGLLLPLELFPGVIRQVVDWLPYRYMLYEPARLFVRFALPDLQRVLLWQVGWLAAGGVGITLLYRAAVRRVNLNGG